MAADLLLEVDEVRFDHPGDPVVAWLHSRNFSIPRPLPSTSEAYRLLRQQYEEAHRQDGTQQRLFNVL